MIKITIELWKHGNPNDCVVLAHGKIWNNLSGTKTKGSYNFVLTGKNGRVYRTGEISGFNRLTTSVWKLLYLCLKRAFEETNE